MISRRVVICVLLIASLLSGGVAAADHRPRVAAASDLKFAMPKLLADFAASSGFAAPEVTFGSSGLLSNQIANGAPFELFLSADESYASALSGKGLTVDDGRLYALGRLALVAPQGSAVSVDAKLDGLKTALAAKSIRHIAIANPDHAPYGRAAIATLGRAGLLAAAEPFFVKGENVAQALQFAIDGGADVALVPVSLVIPKEVGDDGRYALLDETLAEPLRQKMVLMKGASATSRAFYDYLNAPTARKILSEYGFSSPREP